MTWASPIETRDEERRRQRKDVLEDGEYARFDLMMMDNAPGRVAKDGEYIDFRSAFEDSAPPVNVADYQHVPADQREAAMAFDAMVRDLTERGNAKAPPAAGNVSDADLAAAYDGMIRAYQHDRR